MVLMTLSSLRKLTLHRLAIRRTLMLLTFVGAILVGLLAMHTFSSASDGHMYTAVPMSTDIGAHAIDHGMAAPTQAMTATDCDGMCDPTHAMAGMACVLALLISGLMFAITTSRRWSSFRTRLRGRWLVLAATAVAGMPPPDLNALSISRT
ncbi:hypothetical protein GCM10009563_20670 [Subtercola frigoramans]